MLLLLKIAIIEVRKLLFPAFSVVSEYITIVIGELITSCKIIINGWEFIFMNYAKFITWYKQMFGNVCNVLSFIEIKPDCIKNLRLVIFELWIKIRLFDGKVWDKIAKMLETEIVPFINTVLLSKSKYHVHMIVRLP